jgi:hypothetical protein
MASALFCPDPTCQAPAEIIGQWTLDSTDGPVEHVKTCCAAGHVFTPRTESLAAAGADAALRPALKSLPPAPLGAAANRTSRPDGAVSRRAIGNPARVHCI